MKAKFVATLMGCTFLLCVLAVFDAHSQSPQQILRLNQKIKKLQAQVKKLQEQVQAIQRKQNMNPQTVTLKLNDSQPFKGEGIVFIVNNGSPSMSAIAVVTANGGVELIYSGYYYDQKPLWLTRSAACHLGILHERSGFRLENKIDPNNQGCKDKMQNMPERYKFNVYIFR